MQHHFWQPRLGTICGFALIRYSALYLARLSGFPGDLLTSQTPFAVLKSDTGHPMAGSDVRNSLADEPFVLY